MALTFECQGVAAGCWIGLLRCGGTPPSELAVVHRGQVVARPALRDAGPGLWAVSADLPASVIDTGAHSLLLTTGEGAGARILGSLTLVAGSAAAEDLIAEVAQLRAELDLLKREFRRFAAGG